MTTKATEQIVKQLWNEFDPIGVVDDVRSDEEYLSYVPHTLKLVQPGVDEYKIRNHLDHCVRVNMGMSSFPEDRIEIFAQKFASLGRKQ